MRSLALAIITAFVVQSSGLAAEMAKCGSRGTTGDFSHCKGGEVSPDRISDDQLRALIAATQAADEAWVRGDAGPYDRLNSHADDFTIMGPFGGAPTEGYAPWAERAPTLAKSFSEGVSKLNVVRIHASGDLVVLVALEEQQARLGGGPLQPWSLRLTQVYRREGDEWRVVHRHAEPLVRRRSLEEAAAIAR